MSAYTPIKSGLNDSGDSHAQYPNRLNFYDKPPQYDVTLEDFETSALDRLRVLAEIESCAARGRVWEETKTVIRNQCAKYLRLHSPSADISENDALRSHDHLGHFVLRLAFCRSEDLRRRFIKAESTLFKQRYEDELVTERQKFLQTRDFNWVLVGSKEKEAYEKELLSSYSGFRNETDQKNALKSDTFYKVRWTRVPDLIEKRRVFLKGGWAYVPSKEQSSIIFQEFEVQLTHALEMTAKALPRLDEDTRLMPVLDNLSQGFLAGVPAEWMGESATLDGDEIKAEMIDGLAKDHFPLCMRNYHEKLRAKHHLLHKERLNYGLFLKVLGLPIEEAIAFWRKAFIGSHVTEKVFNSEHKYSIRHSYGLEGRRANYPARSCQQLLISEEPKYGCPYRHLNPESLQSSLISAYSSQGLTVNNLHEIMSIIKEGHPHVACSRVFEITHAKCGVKKGDGVIDGASITHPNQWAAKSIEFEKAKKDDAMDVDV